MLPFYDQTLFVHNREKGITIHTSRMESKMPDLERRDPNDLNSHIKVRHLLLNCIFFFKTQYEVQTYLLLVYLLFLLELTNLLSKLKTCNCFQFSWFMFCDNVLRIFQHNLKHHFLAISSICCDNLIRVTNYNTT